MIDRLSVLHRGGALLWSTQLTPIEGAPIDELIQNVLLEERNESSYTLNDYTLKWTFDNQLDLVFVAVYLNFSHILYVAELLEAVKAAFCSQFSSQVATLELPTEFCFAEKYDKILRKFERQHIKKGEAKTTPRGFNPSKKGTGSKTSEVNSDGPPSPQLLCYFSFLEKFSK